MTTIILFLIIAASYYNQNSATNYLLAAGVLLVLLSLVYSLIVFFTVKIDITLNKNHVYQSKSQVLEFRNAGISFRPKVKVVVDFYNRQLGKRIKRTSVMVPSEGEQFSVRLQECGDIEVRIKRIVVKGFFNILRLPKRSRQTLNYKIYPLPSEFDEREIKEITLSGDGEPIDKKGSDYQELYEIRPIQPGDNLRYVHPSLSAKFGEYMIKVGSETLRKLKLYEMKENESFDEAITELSKIAGIHKKYCNDEHVFFCVRRNHNWYFITNERSKLGLFDVVYEGYRK